MTQTFQFILFKVDDYSYSLIVILCLVACIYDTSNIQIAAIRHCIKNKELNQTRRTLISRPM